MKRLLLTLTVILQLAFSLPGSAAAAIKNSNHPFFSMRTLGLLAGIFTHHLTGGATAGMNSGQTTLTTPCPRFPVGSWIIEQPRYKSQLGSLSVNFNYQHRVDEFGFDLFCYTDQDGNQSPVLEVNRGDYLSVSVTNQVDSGSLASSTSAPMNVTQNISCGQGWMDSTSVNLHFHGMSISPHCHKDDIFTLVNSGETFVYGFNIPDDLPPGLYAYHDHVHGQSETALLGGASGAIVVRGIEQLQPQVAGLPERILVFRDHPVPGNFTDPTVPAWDLSLNYIPIPYPHYTPVTMPVRYSERQFWRVVNAGADTILDLQLQYDGVPQPLEVVALDGVPIGSQEGTRQGFEVFEGFNETHLLLPPLARAEFIVTGPSEQVMNATLLTLGVPTGPDGDNDPTRPLVVLAASSNASNPSLTTPNIPAAPLLNPRAPQRFSGLRNETVVQNRTLYFSEVLSDPTNPNSPTNFYITVDGQTPVLYGASNAPALTATQGTTEDWTIENRAQENHIFHVHQLHFLVLEKNGIPLPPEEQQYLDTLQIPFWSGNASDPYPSAKVRMDFRGPDIGTFVYHCHILNHEDNGMMANIAVLPPNDTHSIPPSMPEPLVPITPQPTPRPTEDKNTKKSPPTVMWIVGTATGAATSTLLSAYITYTNWASMKAWALSTERYWHRWVPASLLPPALPPTSAPPSHEKPPRQVTVEIH